MVEEAAPYCVMVAFCGRVVGKLVLYILEEVSREFLEIGIGHFVYE